jgi:hypothetical protein
LIADPSIVARATDGISGDRREVHKGSPLLSETKPALAFERQLQTKSKAILSKS